MAKQPNNNTLAIPPDITEVVDTQDNPVPDGGTTADTTVILSGIGEASAVVRVQDGQTTIGTPSVKPDGSWTQDAPGLSEGLHKFTVRNADGLDPSGEWRITVSTALDLIPPKVTQAPGNVLDPLAAVVNGVDVVVEYTGMLTSDTIDLSWNGLDDLVSSQSGSTSGRVTFHLPASAVAAVLGKTIQVLYTVVRNGTPKPSNVLNLTVELLPPSALEAPMITQAANNGEGPELDVTGLTADADLSVKPWPFIDAGQRISLRFEGTRADGTTYNWPHPGWQDLEITSPGQPYTKVALSDLKELKDGSILRVIFEVSFDGGVTRVLFPVRTYTVKALEIVQPTIDLVADVGGEIARGDGTFSNAVTLTGKASARQDVQVLNGLSLLGTVTTDDSGNWRLPLSGLALGTYSLTAVGMYGNHPVSPVWSFSVIISHEGFETYPGSGGSGVIIPVGTSLEYPTLTFTVLRGDVVIKFWGYDSNSYLYGQVIQLQAFDYGSISSAELRLKASAGSVKMGISGGPSPSSVVYCYDISGDLIHTESLYRVSGYVTLYVPGKKIKSMVFQASEAQNTSGSIYLDSFTYT